MNARRASAASRSASVSLPERTAAVERLHEPLPPGLGGRLVDLADEDVEPGPGAHLGDARPHQAASDDADPLDRGRANHTHDSARSADSSANVVLLEIVTQRLAVVDRELAGDDLDQIGRVGELRPRLGLPRPAAPERLGAMDEQLAGFDDEGRLRSPQLGMVPVEDVVGRADRGRAVDAQRVVEPGDEEQQPDLRVVDHVLQRVEAVVAAEVGDCDVGVVEHRDEPGWAATRRHVAVTGRVLAVASMTIGLLAMKRADASSIDERDLPAAPAPGMR